jgi:uncharacterized membrane protein
MGIVAGSFFFANREWLGPAAIASAIAFLCVVVAYWRSPANRSVKTISAFLKILGLAALLICLLEPNWSEPRAKRGANIIAVVADNSLSMQLRGRGESETRGDMLRRILTDESRQWREQLAQNFQVRNFLADSRLHGTEDFHELDFTGRSTALGGALRTLAERYSGQPLAGIIVLTDGVAPDLDNGLEGTPPIYPLVLGSELPPRDLAITSTAVTQTAFEDAPVNIQADIFATGMTGEEIVATLTSIGSGEHDEKEEKAGEQTIATTADGRMTFRFQVRPPKRGVLFYRLRAAPKADVANPNEPGSEATTANNESIIAVDRGSNPLRLLYVSGRPNWEYAFLHRAIKEDPQTQLVGLIRVAKREPKFQFRGRAGESSNPLFRGFGQQSKEEIERYDQPVLVRLNTQDEFELRDGFPKTAEELFKYRGVIIDDLEAEFFSAEQMSLLQRFVSHRGGGFMMLGGAESFAEGNFDRTPIGDMLPVYLNKAVAGHEHEPLHLGLTREGWLQPWIRLRATEGDETKRLAELPPFDVLNSAREIKPAAMVLATVREGGRDRPALVTQRFGRGRTAALLLGDLWHSGLGDESLQKDLGRMWRQTVRWLVADVPDAIELRVEPEQGEGKLKLAVRVRDPKFLAVDNASVHVKITPILHPDAALTLLAEASSREPGLYECEFLPRESGGYRVEATAHDENGGTLGSAQTGWATNLAADEFRSLSPNVALMESVARQSGGTVLRPEKLGEFVSELPARRAPVTEAVTYPIWHTPLFFSFALLFFVGEWGLRRFKGLA